MPEGTWEMGGVQSKENVFIIGPDILATAAAEYARTWPDVPPLIIADRTTWDVAGKKVKESFLSKGSGDPGVYIFSDPSVYADDIHVAMVRSVLEKQRSTIAVAVGSGTINDIVKRASHECGRPYMCVPTAPSVDGFTAAGAAITVQGFKTTLTCDPPAVVLADSRVLREAPAQMIASGYGDLCAKITAGADWIIADMLDIEPIVPRIWSLVQDSLRDRLSDPVGLRERKDETVTQVFSGLVDVGYAMAAYRDSRPASGADHLLSHVWEMEHLTCGGEGVSHGFKVALGTLVSTALLTEMLTVTQKDLEASFIRPCPRNIEERKTEASAWLEGNPNRTEILNVVEDKFLPPPRLQERRRNIMERWGVLCGRIRSQMMPFSDLKHALSCAGCPVEPADIGLDASMLLRGIYVAQMIRTRYTILDLLYEAGLFSDIVGKAVGTQRYFSRYSDGEKQAGGAHGTA